MGGSYIANPNEYMATNDNELLVLDLKRRRVEEEFSGQTVRVEQTMEKVIGMGEEEQHDLEVGSGPTGSHELFNSELSWAWQPSHN